MITPDEALDLVDQTARPLPPQSLGLQEACGLVLAEDVVADRDSPSFPRSMMDGFAVRLADSGKGVPVRGEIPAGTSWPGELADGNCLAILTGAPCPAGTEAVVPKELARQQGADILLPKQLVAGQNIAPVGSECRAGEVVLRAGVKVTPMVIGVLASFGAKAVKVVPQPRVGIITTGGELAADESLLPGQIRNSNGPMLAAMARELGIDSPQCLHARDDMAELRQAVDRLSDSDIVVLTGGVSVGTYDLVPQALADLGAETVFHGVKQKPGKPLLFARTGRQLFFGLPGNPLACHLGFHRYVTAAVRKMSGRDGRSRRFQGRLVAQVESKGGRTQFVPGWAESDADSPTGWRIAPIPAASSADIFRTCSANCYLEVPSWNRTLPIGELCEFTWLGR